MKVFIYTTNAAAKLKNITISVYRVKNNNPTFCCATSVQVGCHKGFDNEALTALQENKFLPKKA